MLRTANKRNSLDKVTHDKGGRVAYFHQSEHKPEMIRTNRKWSNFDRIDTLQAR